MKPQTTDRVKQSQYDIYRVLDHTAKVLSGNIWFGEIAKSSSTTATIAAKDNLDGVLCAVVTPNVADTEFNILHSLNRIPTGFLTCYLDKAAIIYDSGTAWTAAKIFLKCNAVSASVKVFVF